MTRQRPPRIQPWIWLGWALLGAVAMYILNPVLGFFAGHYSSWIMLGVGIWIGWGLSSLPRAGQWVAAAVLVGLLFYPLPMKDYYGGLPAPPMMANLSWLREHYQPGDVVLLDRNATAASPETWDYFTQVYFPQGLAFVERPDDFRRVWYVAWDSHQDPATEQAVRANRVPGVFVGPPEFLIRLYEGPPDGEGIRFENGMRFHGVDIVGREGKLASGPVVRREGETIRLRLWWSVDAPPDLDYSLSTVLRGRDGQTLDQFDGPPQTNDAPPETSRWVPGRYYVEERTLSVPQDTRSGTYTLYLIVYQWWDNTRISAPGVDENTMLALRTVTVKAW
jgi:hypothetical protein